MIFHGYVSLPEGISGKIKVGISCLYLWNLVIFMDAVCVFFEIMGFPFVVLWQLISAVIAKLSWLTRVYG